MKTKSNKLHIIITVCLAIAVVVLLLLVLFPKNGDQSNESSADVSVNTEVSETVSNNDVSTEVSEEISEEVSEEVSDPEVSVPEDHTHKYADTWKSNETDHWKECECGDKSDIASHTYGEWTTTKEATEDAAGSKKHTCTVCGHEETAIIPALSHTHKYADTWKSNETDHWKECNCGSKSNVANHNYGEWTTTKEATEETDGSKYHTCNTCGYKETVVIPALEHTHKYADTWKSNETDHWKECNCGSKSEVSNHNYGEWTTTKEATEETEGSKYHTCKTCSYKETVTIPALEHTHKYSDKWSNNETSHWKECKCGNKSNLSSHNFGSWTTTKEATEEAEGSRYHTCKTCGYKETETIPKVPHTHAYGDWKSNDTSHWKECKCGDKSQFASHNYGDWTVTKEATEITTGSRYHTCKTCDYKETETIPVIEHLHFYGAWKSNTTSHWKECRCGDKIDAANHTYGAWETTKEATCTSTGTKKHTCTACGYSETETVSATGHSYGDWKNDSTNHWKECTECGNVAEKANHTYDSVVTPPTETEKGYTTHTCSTCGYSYVDSYTDPVGSYSEGLEYKINDDGITCTIIGIGTCKDKNLNIPPVIDGYKVTDIGRYAFKNCTSLTEITIPDSVTTIGYGAFSGCTSLTSITIPDSVTTIGEDAFGKCTKLQYNTYDNAKYLGNDNNPYVVLVEAKDTSIAKCTIHTDTKVVYGSAFYNCTSLTSITIGNSVTTIGEDAFNNCISLTLVIIPDSVTTIGSGAFYWCIRLTSVNIGDSVTTIGNKAFSHCTRITSITIPDSVTTIGKNAFQYCDSLISVTIGNGVTTIGEAAFYYCPNLTSITIPDSVTTIGEGAFGGCDSLTSITVSSGNTAYCSIDGNLYTKDQKTLVQYAIGKSASSFTIPDGVTTIGDNAFHLCDSLTSVIIPDSVTTIGEDAFYYCPNLTSITIPDSVTTIGRSSFHNCDSLTSVTIGNGVTTIGDDTFSDCDSLTNITIPDSVTTIGGYAFSGCDSLKSVTIGNGVTTIGSSAFNYCTSLTGVTIPDSVTTIGNYAFIGCTSLTSVIIGNGVTTIGNYAFQNCTSLASITIPDNVTTIGEDAFWGCDSLTDVYYAGSKSTWNRISIGSGNTNLTKAKIHYNS